MNNNLLIIDSHIKDINIILNSLQSNTYYIILDYINDTYDIYLYMIERNRYLNQSVSVCDITK